MTLFALQPILDYCTESLVCSLYRIYYRNYVYMLDEDHCNDKHDYLSFIDLYAGPEYYFYYKCSITNIIVFTCIIFGGCMPILYFIGLFAIGL